MYAIRSYYELLFLSLALFFSCTRENPKETVSDVKKPNILLILTDDQGYHDVSYYGTKDLQTPRLDALAGGPDALAEHLQVVVNRITSYNVCYTKLLRVSSSLGLLWLRPRWCQSSRSVSRRTRLRRESYNFV